ncbi:hypothetical protein DFH11DRAFT_1689010 [Phellopilus nigrolimitatus]|nr:hypothetical protein DFH11DRAFT_1689010 [Phellopilus nigrolimitatus]
MYFATMYDYQTSSSSSSSSPSGVATPVDEASPVLVTFPRQLQSTNGLASSGSSSSSLDKHRPQNLSHSREVSSFVSRPPKLSLDSSKTKPIPALSCASDDYSPLGAFSRTSSAEGHLRSLIKRTVQLPEEPTFTTVIPASRPRTSSLLSWSGIQSGHSPYDVDDDNEDEHETFWPRRNKSSHHDVPSISRTVSPSVHNAGSPVSSVSSTTPRSASLQIRSSDLVAVESKRPSHIRASTSPSLPRADPSNKNPKSRAAVYPRPSRAYTMPEKLADNPGTFLRAKKAARASAPGTTGGSALNPALAAVERESRLRARCGTHVQCSYFVRCSRSCRVSDAAAGSARHKCTGRGTGLNNPMAVGLLVCS